VRRLAAARAELGDDRFVDVAQREMEADPVAVAERIYAFAGRTLTDDVRTVMGNWATSNRRGSRGEHRYTADEFGLSEGEIQTAFAEYLDEYGSLCR
jgi:hypothetical protein